MGMDAEKRRKLEASGYTVGDAADFLGMDDAERAMLELRRTLRREVRRRRVEAGLTQGKLAEMAGTTQAKVATIENEAGKGIGLDLLMRVFSVAGGKLEVAAE